MYSFVVGRPLFTLSTCCRKLRSKRQTNNRTSVTEITNAIISYRVLDAGVRTSSAVVTGNNLEISNDPGDTHVINDASKAQTLVDVSISSNKHISELDTEKNKRQTAAKSCPSKSPNEAQNKIVQESGACGLEDRLGDNESPSNSCNKVTDQKNEINSSIDTPDSEVTANSSLCNDNEIADVAFDGEVNADMECIRDSKCDSEIDYDTIDVDFDTEVTTGNPICVTDSMHDPETDYDTIDGVAKEDAEVDYDIIDTLLEPLDIRTKDRQTTANVEDRESDYDHLNAIKHSAVMDDTYSHLKIFQGSLVIEPEYDHFVIPEEERNSGVSDDLEDESPYDVTSTLAHKFPSIKSQHKAGKLHVSVEVETEEANFVEDDEDPYAHVLY